jgi:hypothetical protein
MKQLMTMLTAIVALGTLPSLSQAEIEPLSLPLPLPILGCSATGEIPRVFVPAAGDALIDVRTSAPGSVTYRFQSANANIINAALNAQASHERVTVVRIGFPSPCGAVVGGLSAGGVASSITVAP